jgi:hypothetical protein
MLALLVAVATFSGHLRGTIWVVWSLLIAGVAYIVSGEERMQRFLSLERTEDVIGRVQNSVNMNFLELFVAYPFGNGMGAGGTSIPFFLRHYLVGDHIGLENEYCRILLEQGVAGLALWLAFIVWFLGRRSANPLDSWLFGKKLLWFFSLANFAVAATGTGLMTSIPFSMLFFLGIGFVMAPSTLAKRTNKQRRQTTASSQANPVADPAAV